jgi:hypothetical protein
MIWRIPSEQKYTLKLGDRGVGVGALQNGLNVGLGVDGIFGLQTESAVKRFQAQHNLVIDGLAGPKTQITVVNRWSAESEKINRVWPGILKGIYLNESGGIIQVMNRQVAGGVDCGPYQQRVYESQYNDAGVIFNAFDPVVGAERAAQERRSLYNTFLSRYPQRIGKNLSVVGVYNTQASGSGRFRSSWELSVLSHNYPAAANKISQGIVIWQFRDDDDVIRTSAEPALWCQRLSGGTVKTAQEWCKRYIERSTKGVIW